MTRSLGRSRNDFGAEALIDFSFGEREKAFELWEKSDATMRRSLWLRVLDTAIQIVGIGLRPTILRIAAGERWQRPDGHRTRPVAWSLGVGSMSPIGAA